MKRFVRALFAVLLMMEVIPFGALAMEDRGAIIHFEEDSYVQEGSIVTVDLSYLQCRASDRMSGTKEYTYYGNDGAAEWKAVLDGTFLYTGTNASCTYASCDVTIYDTSWYIVSKSPAMKGNKATCDLIMSRKVLGVTVNSVPINMVISCDANGNLS